LGDLVPLSARGGVLGPLCKKCRQTPIFTTSFPPTFSTFRSRRSGAVLGAQDWLLDGSGAALGASWRVRPPVQKVSTNPHFNSTTFPPTFFSLSPFPEHALGGPCRGCECGFLDGVGAVLGARWLFRTLCKKCRQTPILMILISPLISHSSRLLRGAVPRVRIRLLDGAGAVLGTLWLAVGMIAMPSGRPGTPLNSPRGQFRREESTS